MRNRLMQVTTLLTCLIVPFVAHAQPTMNGATFFNANASGDNRTGDGGFHGSWRTNPGVLNVYHNLFLTPNADAAFSAASFYNNGTAGLSRQLSLGLNTFYFYADGFDPIGNVPNFGLNLWFGTTPQTNCADSPVISALALTASNTFVANNSSGTATECIQPNSFIQGANTLAAFTGGYTVTMQSFQVLQRSNLGSNIDRVSAVALGSNTTLDNYGVFTLNVTQSSTVPEPSTNLLVVAGLASIAVMARRRRQAR
ncbi:MAG: PEP-CTERM sorting domain-containing protein [Gemmatimonadaceae bacterium]